MIGRLTTTLALAASMALPWPADAGTGGQLAENQQVAAEVTTTYTETIEHYSIGPGRTTIVAPEPPPQPLAETVPPPPLGIGHFVWRSGHWGWSDGRWVWSPGGYVETVESRSTWEPGHWTEDPQGWVWVEGHWR